MKEKCIFEIKWSNIFSEEEVINKRLSEFLKSRHVAVSLSENELVQLKAVFPELDLSSVTVLNFQILRSPVNLKRCLCVIQTLQQSQIS